MDNLKVQVNNEAESKEVQELFFKLGATLGNGDEHAVLVPNIMGLAVVDGLINFVFNNVVFSDIGQCKEITIQQLRDLVVLKRNDVGDATHLHIKYKKPKALITSDGLLYFYNFRTDKWDHESKCGDDFSIDNVKPIEKEMKMKEYLNPLKAGGYELSNYALCNDSIEVPEGAVALVLYSDDAGYWFDKENRFKGFGRVSHIGDFSDDDLCLGGDFSNYAKLHNIPVTWQRSEIKNTAHDKKSERENDHYFIDVSDVDEVDFYEIAKRYNVTDPAVQHILKKCLAIGNRGYKDLETDLNDILKTAKRALEINGF